MWRNILIRRIVGMVAALLLAATLWSGATPTKAHAASSHGITITAKGGFVQKCKKNQVTRLKDVTLICPKKGYMALMSVGESFRGRAYYWTFHTSKKEAIKASERSRQNKYLPQVKKNKRGEWVVVKRWY